MDIDLPEDRGGGEEDLALSDEDVEFVTTHGTSIGFLNNLDKAALDRCVARAVCAF